MYWISGICRSRRVDTCTFVYSLSRRRSRRSNLQLLGLFFESLALDLTVDLMFLPVCVLVHLADSDIACLLLSFACCDWEFWSRIHWGKGKEMEEYLELDKQFGSSSVFLHYFFALLLTFIEVSVNKVYFRNDNLHRNRCMYSHNLQKKLFIYKIIK